MNKSILLLLFFPLILLVSCEKEFVSLSDKGYYSKVDSIKFNTEIIPIFKANCIRCHDALNALPLDSAMAYNALIVGNYVNILKPEVSKFFVNNTPGHPDDYLVPLERQKIYDWIEQGAHNN